MRVITFQSDEVVDIIMKEGVYYSETTLQREDFDYSYEREKLKGYNPIWFFRLDTRDFETEDFTDGYFFNLFKCEMSLSGDVGEALSKFSMIEMDVEENNMILGQTHSCCRFVYVTDCIRKDMVRAVYRVLEQEDEDKWYYPKVVPIMKLAENVLFENEFVCYKIVPKIKRMGMRY